MNENVNVTENVSEKSSPNVFKLALILMLICAITSALLGVVNYITEDRIAEITQQKTDAAFAEVLPAESGYTQIDYSGESAVTGIWEAETGHVVELIVSGSQGNIDLVVGIDNDGVVTGVSIIETSETPGLGKKAGEPEFRNQYIGVSGSCALTKNGGTIVALTGATITSTAVTNAVNTALAAVATLG